ncbi:MAG: OmpA family protein [Pyrinomonadaceae bacterium]|jgi:outer membrane protein OmpA-like peptidoglycan-associated protein/uncharacterized protein YidB (DUF937 family)|nr:OmpA family protein [Pyrinomonadaceae bacterium]
MSLFDSVISTAAEKFGLGDKAGTLLSALLSMMTKQETGGFAGFLNMFSKAGLGDVASSWVSSGSNAELSDEQVESALGSDAISAIANQVGIPAGAATSALGWMVPQVVDKLTPDGVVPEEKDLLSKIGDFLSGWGGAALGAAGAVAGLAGSAMGGAADKVGDAAGATVDAGKAVVGGAVNMAGDAAGATVDAGKKVVGAVGDSIGGAANMVGGAMDDISGGGGGILKWLLPLILLGLLLLLGWWFCSKAPATTPATNTNTNKANTTVNTNAGANANANANANVTANANANVERKLAEVVLPNGTKLQAFPGGIEDELVKFIQSDAYKNGTEETLKAKWFNFDDLNFVMGKTELTPESKRQLGNITEILKAFPDVKIKIGGYTDKVGDEAKNLKLSDDRAKAVKAALEKAGVGGQVPTAEGYGETQATVDEKASDKEREKDRKTAVRLIKGDAGGKVSDASTKPADANAKPADTNAKPATAANANK